MNPNEPSEGFSPERSPVSPRPLPLSNPPATLPASSFQRWHFGNPAGWALVFWTAVMLVMGGWGDPLSEIRGGDVTPRSMLHGVFLCTGLLGAFTIVWLRRLEQKIVELERRLPPAPDLEPTDQLKR
jgi:hypothetical protein